MLDIEHADILIITHNLPITTSDNLNTLLLQQRAEALDYLFNFIFTVHKDRG